LSSSGLLYSRVLFLGVKNGLACNPG